MSLNANLPLTAMTVVKVYGGGGAATITGLVRGLRYRVVANVDMVVSIGGGTASATNGMYLPAKVVEYFAIGMGDSQGTEQEVSVWASGAGSIWFTPMTAVPA